MSEPVLSLAEGVVHLCDAIQEQNKVLQELVEQNALLIAALIDNAGPEQESERYDLAGRRIS